MKTSAIMTAPLITLVIVLAATSEPCHADGWYDLDYYQRRPPCRLVDTRKDAQGPMKPGEIRYFDAVEEIWIGGPNNIQQQGGDLGCGIPTSCGPSEYPPQPCVRDILISIHAIDSDRAGWLRAWPLPVDFYPPPGDIPDVTILSWQIGGRQSNAVPLEICRDGDFQCSYGEFAVKVFGSRTNVIIELLGYYGADDDDPGF